MFAAGLFHVGFGPRDEERLLHFEAMETLEVDVGAVRSPGGKRSSGHPHPSPLRGGFSTMLSIEAVKSRLGGFLPGQGVVS